MEWLLGPALIFLARMCDVSLSTLRIIFLARGQRRLAPFMGFFEVLIWLAALTQVMRNLDSLPSYLAYAAGFAMGNVVGTYIESRLALGLAGIRIITRSDASELAAYLRAQNYGVTSIQAEGGQGPVQMLVTVVRRGDLKKLVPIIKQFNPRAFYSIEDVRDVGEGIFPYRRKAFGVNYGKLFRSLRKAK